MEMKAIWATPIHGDQRPPSKGICLMVLSSGVTNYGGGKDRTGIHVVL